MRHRIKAECGLIKILVCSYPKLKNKLSQVIFAGCFWLSIQSAVGQVPQQLAFQGVARDVSGKIIQSSPIKVRYTIRRTDPNGPGLFSEEVTTTTSSAGVFTLTIKSVGGALGNQWSSQPMFLKLEIDPNGGSNYIDVGTTQFLSVPYALVAGTLPDFDPVVISGKIDQGKSITSFSTEPTMTWYPKKNAFKVGIGDELNENSFGKGSIALGGGSIASAENSKAIGTEVIANVFNGIVMGVSNNIPTSDLINGPTRRLFQIGNGEGNNRANALTILFNGKIGIGNNVLVPNYLLDIGGRARIKHFNETAGIHFNNSSNVEAGFVGMKTDTEVGLFIGGNWRFWVNAQGNGFLNGNIIQTSDRRLKRDFSPLDNSLSRLSNLKGQHYFWKDTTKSQDLQTGLIAQEVEAYFPELVSTDEKGFKAVNYIGLIPHLIESVKSLKTQTDLISAMKTEMQELRAELNNIKTAAASTSNQLSK